MITTGVLGVLVVGLLIAVIALAATWPSGEFVAAHYNYITVTN